MGVGDRSGQIRDTSTPAGRDPAAACGRTTPTVEKNARNVAEYDITAVSARWLLMARKVDIALKYGRH